MKLNHLLIGVVLFILAQIMVFFQTNGQFIHKWFRDNQWVVAISGVIVSFLFIWGTRHLVSAMNGLFWPTRFIGFGLGMLVYSIGVSYFFNEGINTKTSISLLLCVVLVAIQVFWKTS